MTTPTLTTSVRTPGKNNAMRRQGLVPAVVYGNVKENLHLSLDAKEFSKLFVSAGETTLVTLKHDGKSTKVLIHDVQWNPIRREPEHVDFFAVNLKEVVEVDVPVKIEGVAPVVDVDGGNLIHVLDHITVEALPEQLPHEITIDVSGLTTFDDAIRVSDLAAIEGVKFMHEPEEVIISVTEPISEEELAALDDAPVAAETEFETSDGTADTKPEEEA